VPRPRHLLAAVPLLLGAWTAPALGATFTVNTTLDGDGACEAFQLVPRRDCTLREAVAAARLSPGPDTVTVPGFAATLGPGFGPLAVEDTEGLTIIGHPAGGTVIDARSGDGRAVEVDVGTTGTLAIRDLTISGGRATGTGPTGDGGGVWVQTGTLTLERVTLRDNQAGRFGGALFLGTGTAADLKNVTVAFNVAAQGGGGVQVGASASVSLTHTTVAWNTAAAGGAGVGGASGAVARFSVVGRNGAGTGPDCDAPLTSAAGQGGNVLAPACADPTPQPGDVTTTEPGVAAILAADVGPVPTLALTPTSPAVDRATASVVADDARSSTRVRDGDGDGVAAADAGAHELGRLVVTTTQDLADTAPADGACGTGLVCSLRQAVQQANASAGPDTIVLGPGPYRLTRLGAEDAAAAGDLDVTASPAGLLAATPNPLTVQGEDAALSVVDASGAIDRAFESVAPGAGAAAPALTLRRLAVTGGTGSGGAVLARGPLLVEGSWLHDNAGPQAGGAILSLRGGLRLLDSTLSGNRAPVGSAVYADPGSRLVARNLTVHDNTDAAWALSLGSLAAGDLHELTNVTITGGGGGVDGPARLRGSIVAQTGGPALGPEVLTVGPNLIGGDPVLGPLAADVGPLPTRAPLAGSPALDALPPGPCLDEAGAALTTDARGVPRDPRCDLGAHEALPDVAVAVADDPDPVVAGQALRYRVTATNVGPVPARNVSMTPSLPAGMTLLGVTASAGTCVPDGACALGDLAPGASVTADILVRVDAPGSVTIGVLAFAADEYALADNTVRQTTTVLAPPSPPAPAPAPPGAPAPPETPAPPPPAPPTPAPTTAVAPPAPARLRPSVTLACPRAARRGCRGAIRVLAIPARRGARPAVLARAAYRLRAGTRVRVPLRLAPAGRRALVRRPTVRGRVVVVPARGGVAPRAPRVVVMRRAPAPRLAP
jgi:uncharacterized repeat protein (TIGR01451 family)/CSLREA domain-containing protein